MLIPSPPPNADAGTRGLVSTAVQTFAGVKTFLARIVASLGITAGLARLDLRSDLGANASDVCSVVGSTVADASVNATADLWSARTGIGGTEVTHARMVKGAMIIDGAVAFGRFLSDRPGVSQGQVGHINALAELGLYNLNGAGALALNLGTGNSRCSGSFTSGGILTGVALAISVTPPLNSATGTPAATVTQNADKGRITVPSGATSVVVTNSSITVNSFVGVEWEALPGVTHSVSCAAGSFTVTFSAALGSSLTFRYVVVR
jgi:hypothetical protein